MWRTRLACPGLSTRARACHRMRDVMTSGCDSLFGHRGLEIVDHRLEKLFGRHPCLLGADQDGEVLGHLPALDRLDADAFERLGESYHIRCVIELAPILEPAGPGEDRGNGVGRCRLALLMHAVV